MTYGIRSNGNQHGLVITKPTVVEAMLDRVGYLSDVDLHHTRVIEPAAGDGAFVMAIIDRLYASSKQFHFSFQKALTNLTCYEVEEAMAQRLITRVTRRLLTYEAELPDGLVQVSDFLLATPTPAHLIIGNPPYVRHEHIPSWHKEQYRKAFATFRHRSDLYIAFYEQGLKTLRPGGTLSFICSNRWLKNQYGKPLRSLIHLRYALTEIIDLEEASPFEEDVMAYPAITTIVNTPPRSSANYYRLHDIDALAEVDREIAPLRTLDTAHATNWFSSRMIGAAHEKHVAGIEQQGFYIGIGVATGADKVFIRRDWEGQVEPELLLPLLLAKDLRHNALKWSGNLIINPFQPDGRLIDLTQYPKAKAYFEAHQTVLKQRHVARKYPSKWYKTIDRIKPSLASATKIFLPDISGNTHLLIGSGNYYPHHNLYYITGGNYDQLVLLAAILMSDFVKDQLLEFGNTMNGGYPRWQSQHLKKLQVPIIDAIPMALAQSIRDAYHRRDYVYINRVITPTEMIKFRGETRQGRLF